MSSRRPSYSHVIMALEMFAAINNAYSRFRFLHAGPSAINFAALNWLIWLAEVALACYLAGKQAGAVDYFAYANNQALRREIESIREVSDLKIEHDSELYHDFGRRMPEIEANIFTTKINNEIGFIRPINDEGIISSPQMASA